MGESHSSSSSLINEYRKGSSREPGVETVLIEVDMSIDNNGTNSISNQRNRFDRLLLKLKKYSSFIGPGIIVSVAYIDPGNYSTDVAAGALYKYKLLFIIFLANAMAVLLQCLSCKLGSVTGADLALNCRLHLPWKLNLFVYLFAEIAIIATDLAEVIGCAIALDLLFHIPLPAGVAITIVDVIIVLFAYRPDKSLKAVRLFELAVAILVIIVIVCFTIMLTQIQNTTFSEVMKGYLPSKTPFADGIYQSIGIIGATVMPHSLFLGSGIVQSRLRNWDRKNGFYMNEIEGQKTEHQDYRPSSQSVKRNLIYSLIEMSLSLFTFALYTNSAILIVSGASLSSDSSAANADLYAIHDLLKKNLSPAAGSLFAVALLFSGMSAGFVATMAGQFVSEGFINWKIRPWMRRLITRAIAILPCMVVACAVGREGLGKVLNASQVVLSVCLPFLVAPLAYFTGSSKIMRAPDGSTNSKTEDNILVHKYSIIKNNLATSTITWLVWLLLTGLNITMIVLVAMGKS